jgi:leader peptidase (prepilin peptidase)/N-methyltransferase
MLQAPLQTTIDLLPPSVVLGFAAALGLLFGSFLNVVIYRVPLGMSVVHPASHCPSCKAPVRAWQNVPVLSYVFLRGKSACCGTRLSPRYPLVELIGGVLSVAIAEVFILKAQVTLTFARAGAIYTSSLALALGLVAAAFIDFEHMLIPLSITIGGTVLGVATASLRDLSWTDSLFGGALGFVVVWLPFDFLYSRLRGKTGMAMGDAFLVMLAARGLAGKALSSRSGPAPFRGRFSRS